MSGSNSEVRSDKIDDWKASFKYELKCCMYGFLYGLMAAIAFVFFFTKCSMIVLPICLIAFITTVIWNIRSFKFSIKALLIELSIAIGSFFIAFLIWAVTNPEPIIFID